MAADRLAIEIGGTKLQVAIGDRRGNVLERARGQVEPGSEADVILDQVDALVRELLLGNRSVRSAGIGFGGPVDSATGAALLSHHVAGWSGRPIRDRFQRSLGVPVAVHNDSNAAAWGEYRCGTGKGTKTFCYMNVGSGIGGGLVIDGRLHDGQGRGAFEIGHTRFPEPDGGGEGASILETHCSGWSIEREARDSIALKPDSPLGRLTGMNPEAITCAMLGEAARKGDADALRVIDDVARRLGLAIANAVALVCPEVFAVGGGVSLLGDILFEPLKRYVDEYVFEPYRDLVRVTPAELGEDIVLVGALLLAPEVD